MQQLILDPTRTAISRQRLEEPAVLAATAERGVQLAGTDGDCFTGYGVIGLPFQSGHVLALRRFPSAAGGPAYTSVWHRAPDGHWTFYADVGPEHGCARYFGPGIDRTVVVPIRIEWIGARRLNVAVDGGRLLIWSLCLASSATTDVMNAILPRVPMTWWERDAVINSVAAIAGRWLGAGRLRLAGTTPSGHHFVARPTRIWRIASSRARLSGHDFGVPARLAPQPALGDFLIPNRGLFMMGDVMMRRSEVLARHSAALTLARREPPVPL